MERNLEALRLYRDTERERCRKQKLESIVSVLRVGALVLLFIVL